MLKVDAAGASEMHCVGTEKGLNEWVSLYNSEQTASHATLRQTEETTMANLGLLTPSVITESVDFKDTLCLCCLTRQIH